MSDANHNQGDQSRPATPPQTPPLAPDASQEASSQSAAQREAQIAESLDRYWKMNLRIMRALLLIWAIAGLGCGVLAADWLNQFQIGGFPLGFWFAHQGAIVVFVALILIYCLLMNRLDRKHHEELRELGVRPASAEERDAGAGI